LAAKHAKIEIDRWRPPKGRRRLRRTIRLAQLELLAAMETALTLSAAASAARVTQRAASRLLRALADDLGIELFERAGRALLWRAAGSSGPTIRNHCRYARSVGLHHRYARI